jgi:DNA polymerase phi
VDFSFDNSIRSFRRKQALELLKVFYNNIRMITADEHKHKKQIIENKLCRLSIKEFQISITQGTESDETANHVGIGIRQKYISCLLTLLLTIHAHHISEAWDWEKIGESISKYKSTVSLGKDAKSAYNKLAKRLNLPNK